MSGRMDKAVYERELKALQARLVDMQAWVQSTGARIVVIFEGRDAAGKGSTIKRVAEYLNPRVTRIADLHRLDAAVGVLDTHDGIGAIRYRSARHDANGLAGSDRTRREPPRRDGLEDAKGDRPLGRGRFQVDRTHRVTVHGRVVPRR